MCMMGLWVFLKILQVEEKCVMQIIDKVGNLKIEVGGISVNHVTLENMMELDSNKPAIIHKSSWVEIKWKIDKMFEMAEKFDKEIHL